MSKGLCLILLLALGLLALCPIWAYLSLCGSNGDYHSGQGGLSFSPACHMSVSLPVVPILLVILASFGALAEWPQPRALASISGVLPRAPPLR